MGKNPENKLFGGRFVLHHLVIILMITLGFAFVYTFIMQQSQDPTVPSHPSALPLNSGEVEPNYTLPGVDMNNEMDEIFSCVWIPECGLAEDLVTEQGWIEVVDGYIDDPMPLCLTQEEIDDWYITFAALGGYELWGGMVEIWQKGELVATLLVQIEYIGYSPDDCCVEWWRVTFMLMDEPVCLDSSFYPTIHDDFMHLCDPQSGEIIYDKEVDLYLEFDWTGCHPGNDQDFLV